MKVLFTAICCLLFAFCLSAQNEQKISTIFVDENGVMRWSDTRQEASFYGVNYTLPFAHAYRAMNYLGKNHKEAIDKDVYHFARLGFNAYRIHVWDVEISDDKGNLIENDHLELLDYLIAKLKERNIRVLITTMTNFGNGYPEKNQDTGAFSYLYDKCRIHNDEKAIAAQENYISQFIKHVNPYTQLSYINDPYVIGFEINNEPCHSDTPVQTESYINRMLAAIKKVGNTKPVFYNVSHNMEHVQAYFNTAIQGTTYQWYPIGLVAGHTRQGNFLPYVDSYDIPFSNFKGFDKKAKAVYEYDPADITYSYMYPAMTRAFRSQGFQWITQFAYDPLDMAWANTEYQTHYLNLAYTPGKAVSMKIAAEVAYSVPMNKQYAKYPNDTVFDNFYVSYNQDLSVLNSAEKFYYSNNTSVVPVNIEKLQSIAGCGSSPVISYEGTGAYFLDKLEEGLWRLEVMPDAVQIDDPFAKPSLNKEVVTVVWNEWNMEVRLPGLNKDFLVIGINRGNSFDGLSKGIGFSVRPGVYLLKNKDYKSGENWDSSTRWGNISLGEYAAPEAHANTFSVYHQPVKFTETNTPLKIEAQIVGPSFPDSVIIYTDKISFWSEKNPYVKMERVHGYTYEAIIPANMINEGAFRYNIVVCKAGENYTFPAKAEGNPLDWDYIRNEYWESKIVNSNSPVELVQITDGYSNIETYGIPETSYIKSKLVGNDPDENARIRYSFSIKDQNTRFFWRKYIKDHVTGRKSTLKDMTNLYLNIRDASGISRIKVGFVTSNGFTYTSVLDINAKTSLYQIPVAELQQDKTTLLPSPYPTFLDRYFSPDTQISFDIQDIEMIILSTMDDITDEASFEIGNIWLK